MNRALIALLTLSITALSATSGAGVISMAWSPVGNPGNAADSTGFGAVSYSYQIGTYDVTQGQYVAYLNANDPTGADPLFLFTSSVMGDPGENGDIVFNSGAASGSKYSIAPSQANLPIIGVSWYDAIRFANWMDNGQPIFNTEPTATNNATENGSYTLDGFTATPTNGNSITRNTGAVVFLPSENEWYKAAYYNPAKSSYFIYPTSSNAVPNATGPTSAPNSANYDNAVGNLTDVGAYTGTTSPYGAFDMGGDVWQWNEALIGESLRCVRGGSFFGVLPALQSADRYGFLPSLEEDGFGFRVAMVPEPSSMLLAALACGGILVWRRRTR